MANGWSIVGTRSVGGGGTSPTGNAPDVTSFAAGTVRDDGTYAPNMRWDSLALRMLVDWACVLPASTTNWSSVQIFLRIPNPGGGFHFLDTGATAAETDFATSGGIKVFAGTVGIEGPNIPAQPELWKFLACSYNFAGNVNVDGSGNPTGPSVDLMTLAPGTSPFTPAPQPGDTDWALSIQSLGYDDYAGTPIATLQAVVTPNVPEVKYYSVLQYTGTVAPSDKSLYLDIGMNQERATTGPTTLAWIVTRPPPRDPRNPRRNGLPITQWYLCVASSATYTGTSANAGNPKSVVLLNVATAAQVTGFVVSVRAGTNGGVVSGKLRYEFIPPNDPEFFQTIIDRRETDASFTPLPSPAGDWYNVAQTDIPLEQKDWWVWFDGISFWQFRAQSQTRAHLLNTTNPPIFNLAMPRSGGLNMGGIDPTTLNGTEFQILPTGKLAMKGLDFTKAFNFDTSLFTTASGPFKLNINAAEFDASSGQLQIKNLSWSKIGIGYNTTDFQVINEQIIIKNVDWSKSINTFVGNNGSFMPAKISIYNHGGAIIGWIGDDFTGSGYDGAWFKRVLIGGTSPATAQIYADASGNAVFNGSLAAGVGYFGALAATQITTGAFSVGGGFGHPGKMTVYDHVGGVTGWIGDDTASSGYDGAWFKRVAIGGTSPLNAKIIADSLGNVSFTGSVWAGAVILNANNITTTISNAIFNGSLGSYVGLQIQDNFSGSRSQVTAGQVSLTSSSSSCLIRANAYGMAMSLTDSSGTSAIDMNTLGIGVVIANGYDMYSGPRTYGYRVGGNIVIDGNRYFTGGAIKLNNTADSITTGNVFVGAGANMYGACGATSYNITNSAIPAQFLAGGVSNQVRIAVDTSLPNSTPGFKWCGVTPDNGSTWYTYFGFRGGIYTGLIP